MNNGGTNDLLQFRISDWNENFLRVCCTGTYRQLEYADLIPVDRQTCELIQMYTGEGDRDLLGSAAQPGGLM